MQVISRLLVLAKLRRFCSRSFARLDAAEGGGTPVSGTNESSECVATVATDAECGQVQEFYALLREMGDDEGLRYLEWLDSKRQSEPGDAELGHRLVGGSAGMREVYEVIARVAPTDSTVLLRGESGTGKELVAQAIHQNSPRSRCPFVAINCAALTESLLESELFGHERGAFTGAMAQKKGKLELAEGGTLFLDEISELGPKFQAKLLRVLQEREYERVGGTRSLKANIRLIAATNRDLDERIKAGEFRLDLYYRLNVVCIEMPPLRERLEDIPALAEFFLGKHSARIGRLVFGLSPAARNCLMDYDWPGNVRELENTIERAIVLGTDELVQVEDLPRHMRIEKSEANPGAGLNGLSYHEAVLESKREVIMRAVERAEGNYTEAAKLLDVHPNYLHRLIRNMNLKPDLKRSSPYT
jgi:Nif-specific regulatory protein